MMNFLNEKSGVFGGCAQTHTQKALHFFAQKWVNEI